MAKVDNQDKSTSFMSCLLPTGETRVKLDIRNAASAPFRCNMNGQHSPDLSTGQKMARCINKGESSVASLAPR